MPYIGGNTNFTITDFGDIAQDFVTKDYLLDVYPSLVDGLRYSGLWLWGSNYGGSLGINDLVHRSSPVQTVSGGLNWKRISVGVNNYAGGIKTDGTLWMWGANQTYGPLGTNNTTSYSSPVQTVAGGTNWSQLSCGSNHTGAIKTDGTLWMWGNGNEGQLGTNNTTLRSSPVQTLSGGTNWRQVSCGGNYTAAIKTDNTLWLWGSNGNGNLGTNNTTSYSSPVQTVSAGNNWKQVSCGKSFVAAIKTDGTLWLWGSGNSGQLGDNSRAFRSSPVQTVSATNDWKQVSAGDSHTAAIKNDGTLWVWGGNDQGQLGTNDITNYSSPVQTVSGGTNWYRVVASGGNSYMNTAAIKTDGTLWLWGHNGFGQLGVNDIVHRSSPIQTLSGGTNWKSVSMSNAMTLTIRDTSADYITV